MDTWNHRLGYYEVGNKIILNKSNALLESHASKTPVKWIFNDWVYSKFDWTVPVTDSLPDLYKKRAQQLREKYDYLILYYSGGADSTNVLHAFVNNGILLDEIVMQYPKPVEQVWNDQDLGNNNYFSELKYAAVPHLKKIESKIDPRTKIKFLDQCADTIEMFNDELWFEKYPLGTMITPAGSGRQVSAIKDPSLDKLYEAGKTVCQIYGVDKPLVEFDSGQFYAYFRDANATHAIPTGFELGEIASKFFFLEFFYWTPDMPEIVIKQAQEIKRHALVNPVIKLCLKPGSPIELFRSLIHPLIYLDEATVKVFQTEKPSSAVFRPMDKWFWLPEFKQAQKNYIQVINYLNENIDVKYMADGSIFNGLTAINSKRYLI